MEIKKTPLDGLLIITPKVFSDDRGEFFESWRKQAYIDAGLDLDFVQENQSLSKKGVLRGLHFQDPPYAQGKLVRVIQGAVLDIAVDIRKGSLTYGHHVAVNLSQYNKKVFWIPVGFAHGFVALEDNTIFSYKCTEVYNKESENSLSWNDPDLDINWGVKNPLISNKDISATSFKDFISPFSL